MSKRGKNRHYHYAEKFEPHDRHQRGRFTVFHLPVKAVIISLIVLMMFGLISTTFATYVTENQPDPAQSGGSVMVSVRNFKAMRDSSYSSGANAMNMGYADLDDDSDLAVSGGDMDLAASGWGFSGTNYFYFDNTTTNWSGTIQLLIGKSSYTSVYAMTKVTNTNYYVVQLSSIGWSDATYMAVIAASNTWGSGNWGPSNRTNATKYTNTYTSGCDASDNQRYILTPGSSSNNCSLSLSYKGTDNPSMDTVTLKAHARHSTNGTSYSTSDSTTGGTVKISSYYFSAYNTVSTSDTGDGDANATYNAAKTTSSITSTFTATAASGYRFVGWFTAASGGSSVSTNASYTYSTNGGNKEIYARFIKRVTVSITKSPSAYTGTAPTLTGGGSTAASITVDAGTSVTLNSNVSNTGITCTFRKTSATGTVVTSPQTVTAATTFYACYSLAAPTASTFSYATTTEGAAAITPSKSASSNANPAGTLSYSYAFVSGSSTSYSLNTNTGAFSATVAGTYKIRMTVTDTCSGLTATATRDATVTVKPAPVTSFSYSVTGQNSGAGTLAEPWKVPVGSTTFAITSFIPDDGSRDPNYTYTWTRTDGTYVISSGAVTGGNRSATTSGEYVVTDTASAGTATTDVIHNAVLADTQGYIYKVAVTKTRNNVTSDPYYVTFYYGVTADFLVIDEFDFAQFNSADPIQKIYAEDNGIDYIKSDYEAGGTSFHTMLFFSSDNINEDKVAVWTPSQFEITSGNRYAGTHSALPNDSSHQTGNLITQISTLTQNSFNLMSSPGPKWFNGFVDDYQNARVDPCYPVIHTTVGTSSTVANRPVYFVDTTGITHVNSRVMAFFITESDGEMHYQTGQVVSGRSGTYRFYVPSDASDISFAYVADNNYVLPTYNSGNGTFSYTSYTDHTVLMAWTNTVDLTAEENEGMTTFVADTPGTADANGIYNYTNTADEGNMTTLS